MKITPSLLIPLLLTMRAWGGVSISGVEIDGVKFESHASSVSLESPPALRFSSSAKTVLFRFGPDSRDGATPVRLRYRMEGIDSEWLNPATEMCLWLRLYNEEGKVVGGTEVRFTGETPGWHGVPEKAPLVKRLVQMTTPVSAVGLEVFFISNGGPDTVGTLVADDVNLRIEGPGQTDRVIAIDARDGNRMDQELGQPANWMRGGSKPEIARIGWIGAPNPHPALFLKDDRSDSSGTWVSERLKVPFAKGDKLTLEWRTAFSIGKGGDSSVTYYDLAPGTYRFRVAAVDVSGLPTGAEVCLPVVVTPPIYARTSFWLGMLPLLGGFLVFATRFVIRRRMLKRLVELERQNLLEGERARIARDIHDDLGSNLTQIAYLADTLLSHADLPQELAADIDKMRVTAREATRSLDETVWAVDPEKDTLDSLVGYLSVLAQELLSGAGVHCRLDFPKTIPVKTISSEMRHHVFLAFKEAVNNIIKHARATEVHVRLTIDPPEYALVLTDDGCGFIPEAASGRSDGGHGLVNIRTRMAAICGRCEIRSELESGTELKLIWNLP